MNTLTGTNEKLQDLIACKRYYEERLREIDAEIRRVKLKDHYS